MLLSDLRAHARHRPETADVFGEIVVRRPPELVFDFFADARNEPSYHPWVGAAEKASWGPLGVGTRWRSTATTSRGHSRWRSIEVTGFDRPQRVAQRIYLSSMHLDGAVTFTAVPQGTLVCWRWDLHPHGSLRYARPLLAGLVRRNERSTWTSIKHLLEAQLDHRSARSPMPADPPVSFATLLHGLGARPDDRPDGDHDR